MTVAETSLDALRFEHLVVEGRKKADPADALTVLREALVMWFGTPYGDLGGAPTLSAEVARLEDLRLVAIEERIAADLATGNHRGVVAELETLARDYPYRERLHVLHMLALYRSGRQADALRAFQRTRMLLAEELGIDPSAELRDLEQRILEQDPGLELRVAPETNGASRMVDVAGPSRDVGRTISGYEFRDQVGEGDYGVVYRAFQPSVGRVVAVKAIRPEYINQPAFVRRFEVEANLVAQLEHPHIVPLFDFWRDPDGAYLVMPFLRGGSLAETLRRGPWNLAPALRLLDQVGSAIGYAHRQGVIHRDIKPGNVLLDEEGNAYLSDFGIAGRITDDLGAPMTTSLGYVAPEETRGETLTIRCDVFSLGVLNFHLLTGIQPNGHEPLPSLVEARPGLP
ncbi:MAG: BTAD domain-containing putative transcriptional regulator, partial [Acidimicrobiia bacterium]